MQVQKDEIRNKILEAALEEFLVAGYRLSSMRNIAQQAGITVGNIYSYFSSKDDLFENLLEPTVSQLRSLVFMEVGKNNPTTEMGIAHMTEMVTQVFLQNRAQFLILMNGSAGSKYENAKTDIIELAKQRLISEFLPKVPQKANDVLLADSLSVALIEGIMNIFNKYGGDETRLKTLLEEFLRVIFGDVFTRL